MNLGKIIRMIRQKTFYMQEEFANRLNVILSIVDHCELNKAKLNIKVMKEIKDFCKKNKLDCEMIEREWLGYSRECK